MWAEGKTFVYRYGEILDATAMSENLSCYTRTMYQCGRVYALGREGCRYVATIRVNIYALCASIAVQRKDTARRQKVFEIGGISR